MAFSLADLVPTTPGVGQAAQDIIGNQNKTALDALALENALLRARADQQRSALNDQYMPIALAVQNRKALQEVNVLPGGEPIDPNNPAFLDQLIVSDIQAKIAEQEAAAVASAERSNLLERGRMARDRADDLRIRQLQNEKDATARLKELKFEISPMGRIPANPTKAVVDKIRSGYVELIGMGETNALKSYLNTYGKYLPGVPAPRQMTPQESKEAFGPDFKADLQTPPREAPAEARSGYKPLTEKERSVLYPNEKPAEKIPANAPINEGVAFWAPKTPPAAQTQAPAEIVRNGWVYAIQPDGSGKKIRKAP
jgi:hypothetical protein